MNRHIVTGKRVRIAVGVRKQWNAAGAGAGGMRARAKEGTVNEAVACIAPGGRKRVGEGSQWEGPTASAVQGPPSVPGAESDVRRRYLH